MNGKSGQNLLSPQPGPMSPLGLRYPELAQTQSPVCGNHERRAEVCRHRCSNAKKTISLHNILIITKTQHSRYLPSVNIGEYRAGTERPEDGGLYPLEDPGTYGAVPRQKHPGKWSLPPAYVPR